MSCKDKTPPCPSDCVTYTMKGTTRCRAKPTRKPKEEGAAPRAAYASKAPKAPKAPKVVADVPAAKKPAPVYVPTAVSKSYVKPEYKLTAEQLALREARKAAKSSRESKEEMNNANIGRYMATFANTTNFSQRRSHNRAECSDYGRYLDSDVRIAMSDAGVTGEAQDAAMSNAEVITYIKLKCKLTVDEIEAVRAEVKKVNAALAPLRNAKGGFDKSNVAAVSAILESARVCKYIILESGKVYSEKAKKSGEGLVKDMAPFAKDLGLSVSGLTKAELCFGIAQIIALDPHEFVNGFLERGPRKVRAPRGSKKQ